MRPKSLPILLAVILGILIGVGFIVQRRLQEAPPPENATAPEPSPLVSEAPSPAPSLSVSPGPELSPAPAASPNLAPDLTTDANGLSKATVILETSKGIIRFKLYPADAPNTVARIIELVNQGFYNGLLFHRVVPGFVVQGGDPVGNGTGGSGQKLKAEFNARRHVEGTVAMARAMDPDSADSQFYISLGTHPHLDRSYTVFGQVVEGMDVARKLEKGDKMISLRIE